MCFHTGAGRIGPLPNRPSANRPPKTVGPGQIGPQLKTFVIKTYL